MAFLFLLQFLATFDILFSELSTTRKHHNSFSCTFLGSTRLFSYLHPTNVTETILQLHVLRFDRHPALMTTVGPERRRPTGHENTATRAHHSCA